LIRFVILCIGGVSIIIASFLIIKEKEAYRFLTFSSIIQLGLIFVGIGCANPFGIAGGFYHLINYLTFQPSFLLTIGSVEYLTKSTQMDSFTGFGPKMPITFFSLVIATLASAGVPPLNGFFSKWLLFKGILTMNVNSLSIPFIIIAIFGSILSTIYFLKFLYSFKGKKPEYSQRIRDPGFTMWFPPMVSSILCIILGFAVYSLSWQTITLPTLSIFFPGLPNLYPWTFGAAPILLITSLLIGILIYYTTLRRLSIKKL
jgi:formate hydrogenlyase subunit 3/multisubunit Na+/H+ antiporter MnhD subunit